MNGSQWDANASEVLLQDGGTRPTSTSGRHPSRLETTDYQLICHSDCTRKARTHCRLTPARIQAFNNLSEHHFLHTVLFQRIHRCPTTVAQGRTTSSTITNNSACQQHTHAHGELGQKEPLSVIMSLFYFKASRNLKVMMKKCGWI
ncbi:hypothetical protein DPX16_8756 [Anabarilius grahami]|uniref:Uncharacterized protein n=1 Tax=Anabarilius grahami TaxID=495550 RepID=A0A3N0YE09_ANAGA|nr:hypothetical protein DPX16_8756 [Anabarilius grahami]